MLATIRICFGRDAASGMLPMAASSYSNSVTSVNLVEEG